MGRWTWVLIGLMLTGCGGGAAPPTPGLLILRTVTKSEWFSLSAPRQAALVLSERGEQDVPTCPAADVVETIAAIYHNNKGSHTSPFGLYLGLIAGEPDCDPSELSRAPVDFDTLRGRQWLALDAARQHAAMEWYRAAHAPFSGRCANADAAWMVALVDRYAALPVWSDRVLAVVITGALLESDCLPDRFG